MIVVVSPAKKLDFENASTTGKFSQSENLKKSQLLINKLKTISHSDLSKLMKLSDKLTELNMDRYKSFNTPFAIPMQKQAIYAFQGETYVGFEADSLDKKSIDYAQNKMRILSGLYGILKPLDLIHPYRLEMGTKLVCGDSKNLYEYWKEDVTQNLNENLNGSKYVINCASQEYSSVIDRKQLKVPMIDIVFKEHKGSQLKVVGLFAKRARGMMARFIVENKITDLESLKKFKMGNYNFQEKLSTSNELVFTR